MIYHIPYLGRKPNSYNHASNFHSKPITKYDREFINNLLIYLKANDKYTFSNQIFRQHWKEDVEVHKDENGKALVYVIDGEADFWHGNRKYNMKKGFTKIFTDTIYHEIILKSKSLRTIVIDLIEKEQK